MSSLVRFFSDVCCRFGVFRDQRCQLGVLNDNRVDSQTGLEADFVQRAQIGRVGNGY
jgi:hypothetical protein